MYLVLTADGSQRSINRLYCTFHLLQRARLPIPPNDCNVAILPVATKDLLPISPRFSPYEFLSRCKISTFTRRKPMVELLLTFSRFPLRKPEYKIWFSQEPNSRLLVRGYLLIVLQTRPLGRRGCGVARPTHRLSTSDTNALNTVHPPVPCPPGSPQRLKSKS